MGVSISLNQGRPWQRVMGHLSIVFLLLMLSGSFFSAHAVVCAPPTVDVNPIAPQTEWLRSYRFDFKSPLRLALNAAGDLFIADPQKGEVVVRAADGRILRVQRGLGRPGAIAIGDAGRIFVGDLGDGAVSVFDQNWGLQQRFALGAIRQIGDIALDSARSRVYISDSEAHQVLAYSSVGAPLFAVGGPGDGDGLFQYPSGVFYDAVQDELLVSDQFGYRVQVFDANGQFKYCIGGSSARPGSFFQGGRLLAAPQGLWADAAGRIYVADSYQGKVKVLDRRGRLLSEIGRFGEAVGELRIPSDVVVDGAGRLYVASTNNARIEMFGIDAFSDPELYSPVLLNISPSLVLPGNGGVLSVVIRSPGVRIDDILVDSLRLNSVTPLSVERIDNDRDGEQEMLARFDLAALQTTLPPSGPGELLLDGLAGSLRLHGIATIEIASVDGDSDGVEDTQDQCPASPAGEPVDGAGCSISQLCPCDEFKGHGAYVKCVARASKRFVRDGLLERKARKQIVRQAARSDCGKGRKRHRRGRDDDHHDDDDHEDADDRDEEQEPDEEEDEHPRRGDHEDEDDDHEEGRRRGRNRR